MANLSKTVFVTTGITGIILLILGAVLISLVVIPRAPLAVKFNASKNKVLFAVLAVIIMTLALLNFVLFLKQNIERKRELFMIGDGRRLTADQYDNTKLMSTQGRLQESREMLAKKGYPFTGLETHETHLKENFIAQNLPLWTEK